MYRVKIYAKLSIAIFKPKHLFVFSRTTHNTFAIAIVNSDFKTAEADYTNLDDLLFSGLDILSDVTH